MSADKWKSVLLIWMSKHEVAFFFPPHRTLYSCIQMYNILSMYQFYTTVFPLISGPCATRLLSLETGTRLWDKHRLATVQRRSVPSKISHLTEDDRKIHVDAGMVKLHNALWNKIFLDSLQLGLLSAIFRHHRLFIEFMGEISILVIKQRALPGENQWCCVPGSFEPSHRLLVPITDRVSSGSTAWERPDTFGFGSTASHPQR